MMGIGSPSLPIRLRVLCGDDRDFGNVFVL